jgi:hypothetical protein
MKIFNENNVHCYIVSIMSGIRKLITFTSITVPKHESADWINKQQRCSPRHRPLSRLSAPNPSARSVQYSASFPPRQFYSRRSCKNKHSLKLKMGHHFLL